MAGKFLGMGTSSELIIDNKYYLELDLSSGGGDISHSERLLNDLLTDDPPPHLPPAQLRHLRPAPDQQKRRGLEELDIIGKDSFLLHFL